jgi:hypothetical protein
MVKHASDTVLLFALYCSLALASAFTIVPRGCASAPDGGRTATYRLQDARRGSSLLLSSSSNLQIADDDADDDDVVRKMVWRMTMFSSDMVDREKQRFYYLCLPQTGERLHQHVPVRDLAAAWDATKALLFWKSDRQKQQQQQQEMVRTEQHHQQRADMDVVQQRLAEAVSGTLQFYSASFTSVHGDSGGAITLNRSALQESPNIAHSALFILASAGALRLSLFSEDNNEIPLPVDGLTRGILSMQRNDGAFKIEFGASEDDNNVYRGIEFYPGEAMVALMDVYELSGKTDGILDESTRQAILPAMERAFAFYADFYHQGNVGTNYNIWQVQAFARLFDALREQTSTKQKATCVAKYVLELCRDIVNSKSWKYELARGSSFYPNLETVEIACGLDALVDGIRVALVVEEDDKEQATLFWTRATNAVNFLQWAQDQVPPESTVGRGGLGYGGIQVLEQRLDVTGHAISAVTKLYPLKQIERSLSSLCS